MYPQKVVFCYNYFMVNKFDYVRDALVYLIKRYSIKELYLPYYLCDVVRHKVVLAGCKPLFYHIDDNFYPQIDFPTTSWILYPNYFGICDYNVEQLTNIYPNLIVDNAHAFYSKPQGLATLYSAKKFSLGNDAYLVEGNESWNRIDEIAKKRQELFLNLDKKYSLTNLLRIDKECIPFCYPYLARNIEEADLLVNKLKLEGKTIYRYWSPLPQSYSEYKFYSRLVPIPFN